jgi:hypothetical protein
MLPQKRKEPDPEGWLQTQDERLSRRQMGQAFITDEVTPSY